MANPAGAAPRTNGGERGGRGLRPASFCRSHPPGHSGEPRFTFMATNSFKPAAGGRFAKAYAADYRLSTSTVESSSLSCVVAARLLFPPFLSPVRLGSSAYGEANDRRRPSPVRRLRKPRFFTDGGVYDNLGLSASGNGAGPFSSAMQAQYA